MEEFDHIDEVFREGLKNAQLTPPPGVWEGIASSASVSTGAASWILGKWIAAILAIGGAGVAAYYFSTNKRASATEQITVQIPKTNSESESNGETPSANGSNSNVSGNQESSVNDNKTPFEINRIPNSAANHGADQQINQDHGTPTAPASTAAAIKNGKSQEPIGNKSGNEAPESKAPCSHTLGIKAEKVSNTVYSLTAVNPKGIVKWQFGDGMSESGFVTSHIFPDVPGKYVVKAYSESLSPRCFDSAFYTVQVAGPKPILTNIFTPNGDGFNDQYYVDIKNTVFYDLTILDMQNRVVFSSTNPDVKWDGTCRNIQCPGGKYQVVFSYRYAGEINSTVLREILTLTRE